MSCVTSTISSSISGPAPMTPFLADGRKKISSTRSGPSPSPKPAASASRAERSRARRHQLQSQCSANMLKKRSAILAAFSVGVWAAAFAVCAGCALAATLAPGQSFAQALERPQSSLELIDPKALRVCADPHNMPFSTEKGEGFENKVAELLAGKLGRDLSYTW